MIIRRLDDRSPGAQTPIEAKSDYNRIQRGGDVPYYGLRMSAPDKPKGKNEWVVSTFSPDTIQ